MKQGNAINRIIMLVLLGAVVLYLAVSAWNSLTYPFSTVVSYAYTVDDAVECTGFVVREETVLAGTGGIVDLLPEEGEKVARGETVALVYQSEAGLDRKQQIQALTLEREQLQYVLAQSAAGGDTAQLSQQVIGAIVALRSSVAAGDLTGLEEETMSLKSLVYKREYTYGEGDGGAGLEDAILAVDAQIQALSNQAALDTARVSAAQAGVFSGQVDGYEGLLTPEMLSSLTPADLTSLANQRPQADGNAIGKLVTSARWYFVCPLSERDAERLNEGGTIAVRFSRDWSGQVEMDVERIGAAENGRCVAVLSTDRYLSDTTLLRRQTVELIFETRTGIRVPKAALRVEERTVTDEDTGEKRQVQINGVYALVGAQAEFKPVTVLAQQDDFCLVQAASAGSAAEAKKALRAGDEIIVAAEDLFDGKVVR